MSSSTLTFLFTDIEGSTQLWEKHPETMKLALARHDLILRQAIESHGGHVFKTVGDAFCAAFPSALDAVLAALDAQQALSAESWDQTTVIKVRMSLHSGAAEVRDNDYFGATLNRAARLMSAGHGGQILLSAITRELMQANLPKDVELHDMGERGLKDLIRPEHIYQLTAPGLQTDFPPLKTLETFRTNLPVQLTSFIGREKEISAVKSLMTEHRLTTLTGSGGTGKTRLSLQVAADLLDSFPDGVWFIEFAPLSDPALVPQTVLTTLGLREENGRPVLETLTHYLHTKKVLLILDNCEHLVEAAAQLAEALLRACSNLHLLVSSREALGIPGEKAYHVRSLSIPNDISEPIETITQYEAVRLFVDRAQAAFLTFAITNTNASAVAQICTRLDGIPLAIELAAARIKLLKVEQIAERLDDRFRLLTGGSRTALPRQQTLRAMIDWSYDLLPESERVLLRRLSVFAGGWTLEAAETVCQGPGIDDYNVLDPLAQLVNKSLVVVDADDNIETRYRLLETVRQYAREKLSETRDGMAVRDAHLQYFLGLAERAEPEGHGPRIFEWLRQLEAELDNIRTALAWSLKRDALVGLRLSYALWWFWDERGYVNDLQNWLAQLLQQSDAQARTIIRARALGIQGQLSRSRTVITESLALCRELDDKQGQIHALIFLANTFFTEDYRSEHGLQFLKESLLLSQELGDKPLYAVTLQQLGTFTGIRKEYEGAYKYLEEALIIFREMGHLIGIASSLSELSTLALRQADYAAARHWLEESLAIEDQLGKGGTSIISTLGGMGQLCYWDGDYVQAFLYHERRLSIVQKTGVQWWEEKWILAFLGYTTLRQGNIVRARKLFVESQRLSKKENYTIGLIFVLEGMASLAALQQQPVQAAQLFSFTDSARELLGDIRPPNEQAEVDRDIATIRAHLDEATFAAAQEAGCAMSMDEAIALALESTHE